MILRSYVLDERVVSFQAKWTVSLNDFNLLTVIGRGSYAKVSG